MLIALDPADVRAALAQRPDIGPGLLRMFDYFDRIFELKPPSAPGLRIVGGVVRPGPQALDQSAAPLSVTGNGWTLGDAFVSLLGEAAELVSQFEQPGDLCSTSTLPTVDDGWISALAKTAKGPIDHIAGVNLTDGGSMRVPADIVLRRSQDRRVLGPAGALSSGVAAGADTAAALERALLELIERDAAALWWLGGRQGVPLEAALSGKAAAGLAMLRQGDASRTTRFIDITTDIGVPVVVACSHDLTGHDLAVGIACRPRQEDAADAALRELGQMELSATIAALKRQGAGEVAMNDADRRHLRRARFNANDCQLLVAAGAPGSGYDISGCNISKAMHRSGHPIISIDLTRPELGTAVMRAVCAGLQPFCETVSTPRFDKCQTAHGGGHRHHGSDVFPF
jgi:ribosomal protein S12 methylthiotransferase accessory factor YcaO